MKEKIKKFIKNNKKTIFTYILLIILINIFSNYQFILSLFNKTDPITYNNTNIGITSELVEIKDISKPINMIEITFSEVPQSITISYTSDDFENYNHHNQSYTKENIYINKLIVPTSINGNVNNLKIDIKNGKMESIVLNPKIKYKLNLLITIIILIAITFIKSLLTKNNKLDFKNKNQKCTIFITIALLVSICIGYYLGYSLTSYTFGDIYELYYTDAIMDGKLTLDYPVDEKLLETSNPYDTSNRNFEYLWDASYYNGKYYCYFGIWPIISLFIPFKILTTKYLPTPLGCLFYSVLGIIITYFLYKEIIKKYFKNINLQTYILSFVFIMLGSKMFWCMYRPSFYELASLAAYFHIILGLYLTLFSDNKIKNLIGYTSLALAVLCRPTSLLCSILVIPKLFNKMKNKKLKLLDIIVLVIPYLIVGITTMYLNYVRFGSIFEFGISYQLTTNNLYNYSFSLINSLYGTFVYFFGKISIIYPFRLLGTNGNIPIITDFYIETIGGGIITTSIIGLIIFFIPIIFKQIKEKELKIYIILALTIGISMIILSSGIGSLIGRYMLDFNYLFYFIIVILSLYVLNILKKEKYNKLYLILIIISIFINFMLSTTNYT